MPAARIFKETRQFNFIAFSFAITLIAGVACTLVIPEPTDQPIVVTPVAYQSQTPAQAPSSTSAQPAADTPPTPTPTPWPTATPDTSIPLATPTLSPTAPPVETPAPRPTRIPTLRPPTITESSALTRETAIWRAMHWISMNGQNLEGADLSNHSWVKVNFAYANLRGVNFRGANLRQANLRHADLTGADLTGADLTDADLTGAVTTGATFKDLSRLNWIDRELVLTGEQPLIPHWLFSPVTEESFVWDAEYGDRVAQGQELRVSAQDWCWLNPTRKLTLMEYAEWLGNNTDDWLERGALDRCPLAG